MCLVVVGGDVNEVGGALNVVGGIYFEIGSLRVCYNSS